METPISNREREIIDLITNGYDYKSIALVLSHFPGTIVSHKKNIMRKMKAKNVAHLVKLSMEKGVI